MHLSNHMQTLQLHLLLTSSYKATDGVLKKYNRCGKEKTIVKVVPSKCHFKEKKIRKRIRRKSQILDVYTIKSQNIGGKMKKMAS